MNLADEARRQQKGPGRTVLSDVLLGLRLLLGLGFAALLVLVISKRGPWRAVVLAAGLLVFTTVLPWRLRRWGLTALVLAVIGLIVWIFVPEEQGRWRPYHLDEEFAAYNRTHAVPDEENAAVVYDELGQEWAAAEPGSDQEEDEDPFGEWLAAREEHVIERLREAAGRPACFWEAVPGHVYEPPEGPAFLVSMARHLSTATSRCIESGKVAGAIDWVELVIRTADRVQGSSVAWWEARVLLRGALHQISSMLVTAPLTQEEVQRLCELAEGMELDGRAESQRNESLTALWEKDMLVCSLYQRDGERVRRSGAVPAFNDWERYYMRELVDELDWEGPGPYSRKLERLLAWFIVPADPAETLEKLDGLVSLDEAAGRGRGMEPDECIREWNFDYLLIQWRFVTEDWGVFDFAGDDWLQEAQRGTLLVAALRRYRDEHGQWPAGLTAIEGRVAPELLVDGRGYPVQYDRMGESFRLYNPSTGMNHWKP